LTFRSLICYNARTKQTLKTKKGKPLSPDSLIDRISKLLSLAGNNPSEKEAEAAAAKAAHMMAEHNISMAQVASAQAANDMKNGLHAEYTRVYMSTRNEWVISLASVVARACDGRIVFAKGTRYSEGFIDFFGPEGSVESMIALFRYLEFQFPGMATSAFLKEKAMGNPIHGKRFKNSYLHGLVAGVQTRFREMRRVVDENNSSALVVIGKAVEKKMNEVHGRTRAHNTSRNLDRGSYYRGMSDAKNLDMNQPKMGSGSRGRLSA
jgi:hypothetical protein